jgi:hypothetical protein
VAEVHGFAVGTLRRDAGEACFGETDSMFRYGGDVNVFRLGVEEGDCWDVVFDLMLNEKQCVD